MALKRLIFTLLIVASVTADEHDARFDRHVTYSDKPAYHPTIQYYFINKFQNGPVFDLDETKGRFAGPYVPTQFGLPSAASDSVSNFERTDFADEEASYRQLGIINGFLNNRFTNGNANLNTFRPFNNFVSPVVANPDIVTRFSSCDAGSGEKGICTSAPACAIYGGKASGSCGTLGLSTCCVNTVKTCGGSVTLNNTYWQSPTTLPTTPTACTLTVRLDDRTFKEQTRPICQVRLDFVAFSIAQPAGNTVCGTDTFQVGGTLNTVPTICGDNDNQHMYLHVSPSNVSPSDIRLTFNLGTGTFTRSWNMRISMLPCVSTYLAPPDCLQYFAAASGTVFTFNWKDLAVATTDARQLANQNYKICFRTEVINNRRADRICYTECTATNGDAFRLSGAANGAAAAGPAACATDYIGITAITGSANDRLCGNALTAPPVCSTARSFEILYVTNGLDVAADEGNTGFCLQFSQQIA